MGGRFGVCLSTLVWQQKTRTQNQSSPYRHKQTHSKLAQKVMFKPRKGDMYGTLKKAPPRSVNNVGISTTRSIELSSSFQLCPAASTVCPLAIQRAPPKGRRSSKTLLSASMFVGSSAVKLHHRFHAPFDSKPPLASACASSTFCAVLAEVSLKIRPCSRKLKLHRPYIELFR